jgi:hypothetical protein
MVNLRESQYGVLLMFLLHVAQLYKVKVYRSDKSNDIVFGTSPFTATPLFRAIALVFAVLGMDILGAVASGVQLATLCYQITAHFCNLPHDRRAIASIREAITSLRSEINGHLPRLTPDLRVAAQDLASAIDKITTDIDTFRQKKSTSWFQKPATRFSQAFIMALQLYQTRAIAIANEGMKDIFERLGPDGLSREMKDSLESISRQLNDFNTVAEQVATTHNNVVDGKVKIEGTTTHWLV